MATTYRPADSFPLTSGPTAAASIVAGAENSTTTALQSIWTPHAAISDETVFRGSRDDYQQLDQGQAGNPANEYTNAASFGVNQARWLADNAVKLIEGKCPSGYTILKDGEVQGYSSMSSVQGSEGEVTGRRWGVQFRCK